MDLEEIEQLVQSWETAATTQGLSIVQLAAIVQCRLLLKIWYRLDSIEDTIASQDTI